MNLRQETGAVLPIVLAFSAFAIIVSGLYLAGQYTVARPFLGEPASFQALCNARSGIWKGMDLMSKPPPDTLARINTLDSMFNKKLFGKETDAIKSDKSAALAPGDSPMVITAVRSDAFGDATLSLSYSSCFEVLSSAGRFRDRQKTARAVFGGRLYSSPDTVCYLSTGPAPEGGAITGKTAFPAQAAANPAPTLAPPSGVSDLRKEQLAALVAYYRAQLAEKSDTTMPAVPQVVQSSEQLKGLPEVVRGPLFVNAIFGGIDWKEKRRIFVLGDIQFSGKANIGDVEFVVAGNVQCSDDCRLRKVSIFCTGSLTIADRAIFSGSSLATSWIMVCKDARVEDRSVMVSFIDGNAPQSNPAKQKAPLSVSLSNNASVDGVIVACGNPGTMKTDKNVQVRGILWAQGSVVHQGSLYGILRANDLTDAATLLSTKASTGVAALHTRNSMTGAIIRLPEVTDYPCPFFLGKLAVVRWEED